MNRQIIFTCGLLVLMASAGLGAEDKPEGVVPDKAVAPDDTTIVTIEGEEIPLGLFRSFYSERLLRTGAEDTPAFQNQAFGDFVNMLVAAQDARKKGLDEDERIKSALAVRRLELLYAFALEQVVKSHKPSDQDLQQAYDARYGEKKRTEYKARHILVKTEDEAEKLIEKLKGGGDFAALAKDHSLGPTGKNGGDLPWFGPREMVRAFTDAVAALEPGKYTDKPVQTQFGWHVIQLEETRETEPPAIDEVKNELILALRKEAITDHISKLRDEADLKLNPDLIKEKQED